MYDIIDLLIVSRPYTQNRRHKPHSANFTQYTSQTFVSHHVSITTFCIHVRVYICHSYTIVVHNIEISCFRGRFPNDSHQNSAHVLHTFIQFYILLHVLHESTAHTAQTPGTTNSQLPHFMAFPRFRRKTHEVIKA